MARSSPLGLDEVCHVHPEEGPRLARAVRRLAVVTLGALHVQAAVLPLAGDATGAGVGMRAGLLDEPMSAVSGQWVGRTSSGRLVSLVLRVSEGAVVADATLDGVVADVTNGPRPLVTPTVSGRTMAFGVLADAVRQVAGARGRDVCVAGIRPARPARRIDAHLGSVVEGQLS